MKTCRIVVFMIIILCVFPAWGEPYEYQKGTKRFRIEETKDSYKVYCISSEREMQSRNRNIVDRQNRVLAVDLIGTYIVFTTIAPYSDLGVEYFPYIVEGIDLHYNAIVEGLRQEDLVQEGKTVTVYSCRKDAYHVDYASYDADADVYSLILAGYQRDKCEQTARLLYECEDFESGQLLTMERDFLLGQVQLPSDIRQLQSWSDRFERSVYSGEAEFGLVAMSDLQECPSSNPYKQFYYEELVTSALFREKNGYYKRWIQCLFDSKTIYEEMLLFCAEKCCQADTILCIPTFSSVIEMFPGAISPFGIRQPIHDSLYNRAVVAYAASDFEKAVSILQASIDAEGISAKALNLIGASYRYLGKPEKAMPYLLLCFKLNPCTEFLAGNLAMCMEKMGFDRMEALCRFLLVYGQDSWSEKEINKLKDS